MGPMGLMGPMDLMGPMRKTASRECGMLWCSAVRAGRLVPETPAAREQYTGELL